MHPGWLRMNADSFCQAAMYSWVIPPGATTTTMTVTGPWPAWSTWADSGQEGSMSRTFTGIGFLPGCKALSRADDGWTMFLGCSHQIAAGRSGYADSGNRARADHDRVGDRAVGILRERALELVVVERG